MKMDPSSVYTGGKKSKVKHQADLLPPSSKSDLPLNFELLSFLHLILVQALRAHFSFEWKKFWRNGETKQV